MRVVLSFALLVSPTATFADSARQFVEHFAVYCAANPGRPDKTVALASLEDLDHVETEILTAFGPQTPASELTGWYVVNNDSQITMLAVSRSHIGANPISTCTVYGSSVSADSVIEELSSWTDLSSPNIDQVSFGNRVRLWRTDIFFEPVRLILDNPIDSTVPGVSLGIVASDNTKQE